MHLKFVMDRKSYKPQATGHRLTTAWLKLFMISKFRNGFWLLTVCGLQLAALHVQASSIDSLRFETINGKQFIIHQVDPKDRKSVV